MNRGWCRVMDLWAMSQPADLPRTPLHIGQRPDRSIHSIVRIRLVLNVDRIPSSSGIPVNYRNLKNRSLSIPGQRPSYALSIRVKNGRSVLSARERAESYASASTKEVSFAIQSCRPLSGLMESFTCVTLNSATVQSSHSHVVLSGLKVNSCRRSSR